MEVNFGSDSDGDKHTHAWALPESAQVVNPFISHPLFVVDLFLLFNDLSDFVLDLGVGHHYERPGLSVSTARGRTSHTHNKHTKFVWLLSQSVL